MIYVDILNDSAPPPRHLLPCSEELLPRLDRQMSAFWPGLLWSKSILPIDDAFQEPSTPLSGALTILQNVFVSTLAAGGPERPQGRTYLRTEGKPFYFL